MNTNILFRICCTVLLLLQVSCSSDGAEQQKALSAVTAPYAEGGINLALSAEPGLNAWKGMPNSVTVLVIQAGNNGVLEDVLNSKSGLHALFKGTGAHENILKVDRYTIMPGQQSTLHIDRAENTLQIAVVAGYYPFPTVGQMARFSIPVVVSKKHWWSNEWDAKLMRLQVAMTFGDVSITRISGANNVHKGPEDQSSVIADEER